MKGNVAFITGAAHGQGRATALALAKEGVHIAAFDIAKPLRYPGYELGSASDLESVKTEVEKLGAKALIFQGDVRNNEEVHKAVQATITHFKRIDILFNNAGICA